MSATDWKEEKTGDEDARFQGYAEFLHSLQKKSPKGDRALHAKGVLALEAELTVLDGLPEALRVGLAAKPGTYRAYVRYSNGSGTRQPDPKGDLRGFAVKICGVEGKKVIPGMENAPTQDFLCINHPVTLIKNADEFISLIRALQNPLLALPRLIGGLGFGRTLKVLSGAPKDLGVKITSVAWTPYYTAAPVSWGKAAAKVSFEPVLKADPAAVRGNTPGYLGEEMTSRVQKGAVVYDLRVQLFENEQTTPIEDHTVEWTTPYVTVARLTIGQQDPTSPRGQKVSAFIEKLSFDPWHALVEHRPLGNVMRARNFAYRASTQERGAAGEPDGTEKFD